MLLLRSPTAMLLVIGAILALLVFAAVRATWRPGRRRCGIARRRSWGQILAASARMYVTRLPLLLGIGVLLIPIGFAISILQWLLFRAVDLVGVVTGQGAGFFALFALVIGTTLTLLGLGARPGGDRVRPRRARRRPADQPGRGLRDRVPADPPAAPHDRAVRRDVGRC